MNKGLSLASGEFAIVLNADDYYTEDAIAKLVNKALAEKADITAAHSKISTHPVTGWRANPAAFPARPGPPLPT